MKDTDVLVELREGLQAVLKEIDARTKELVVRLVEIEGRSDRQFKVLTNSLEELEERSKSQFKDIGDRFDRMDRKITAIETLPTPMLPRPRSYISATEMHSVSDPVRRRMGHYG